MACAIVLRPAITLPFSDSPGQYVLTLVTGCYVERGSAGWEDVFEGKGYAEFPERVSGHRSRSYPDNKISRIQNERRAARGQGKGVFAKQGKRRMIFFKLFMPWYVRRAEEREKNTLTEAVNLLSKAHALRPSFEALEPVDITGNNPEFSITLDGAPIILHSSLDLEIKSRALSRW